MLGILNSKKMDKIKANKAVKVSSKTVKAEAFCIHLFTFLKPWEKHKEKTKYITTHIK